MFQSLSVWFSTIAQPCSLSVAPLWSSEQDQPIARLPDRRLDDVADAHAPLAFAGEVDRDRLLVLVARLRERRQRLGQLVLELRVVAASSS